jgi:hypothetical protein
VAEVFLRYHDETGLWPCAWTGKTSSITLLASFQCLQRRGLGGKVVDEWDSLLRVVYQAPDAEIEGAEGGVIALISPGPDGKVNTRLSRAIHGKPEGDDRVHVVTRDIR